MTAGRATDARGRGPTPLGDVEAQALFREMVDGLPLIVWVHDADGQQVMVNQTFCEFFGVTREEMKGGRWQMLTHPDDAEAYAAEFFACVRERRPFHAEVRARRADGAWRTLESWGRPRLDDAGGFHGFVGASADITDKKQAHEDLRRALTLIEGITAGTEDLIAAVGLDLRFTYFNAPYAREYERLWRRRPSVGDSLLAGLSVWPEECAKARALLARALRGESFRTEMEFGPDPAVRRSYDLRFSPLRDPRGHVIGAAHIFRDVTEEVRVRQALRASEERALAIVTSIADGFATVDRDWRLTFINPRGDEMARPLTAGRPDPRGRVVWELFPELRNTVIERQLREAMATRTPVAFEVYFEPLGGWFDVRGYPTRDGGLSVYFLDISERKWTEQRLLESDRRKDEYLAMLGHELRNPLAAIQNATELVKLTRTGDPRLDRATAVLERQSTHMARLIEGLLEVSRIARGKIRLERHVLDVREVVTSVAEDRGPELAAHRLELRQEVPSEPLWVDADRVRLAQILDNVVGNAIKFTAPPGRITIELATTVDDVTIRVRDTGIGIAPDMLARVFEPFHQEDQDMARGGGGLGLGLALAKGLVELHGGTIAATSRGRGTGTEIVIELPRCAAPPAREPPRRGAGTPRRILLVEDNVDAAQMLLDVLRLQGHDVEVAHTGVEALARLQREPRDLVLCDLGLPGMSGYELAQTIRAEAALRGVVLVALTGYGQPEDRERTARAGFDAHVTKPVSAATLAEALALRRQ